MEEEEHLKFIVSRSHAGNVKQQVGLGPFISNLQELPGPSRILQRTEPVFVYPQESIPSLAGRYDNPIFVPARQATKAGGIDSSESILELCKSLQIRAQCPNL